MPRATALRTAMIAALFLLLASTAYGQLNPRRIVLVTGFDGIHQWRVVAEDAASGHATSVETRTQYFLSVPYDKEPIESATPTYDRVLGTAFRVTQRAPYRIRVQPTQPILVGEQGVQQLSVWVQAQNNRHELSVVLLDDEFELLGTVPLGILNYTGWKRLSAWLPSLPTGIYFDGFIIECDALDVGPGWIYYYFDQLTAVVE